MKVKLYKFPYKYMEYENVILDHIIQLAFSDGDIKKTKYYYEINIADELEPEFFEDIPYIYRYEIEGQEYLTCQAKLELSRPNFSEKRQGTRYSTHGLHEYKGKYNPQVVQGVIKYMNIKKDAYIMDPFCGSGTTMVECTHNDYRSLGTDINPMAVFISNTKIQCLALDTQYVKTLIDELISSAPFTMPNEEPDSEGYARLEYLKRWIPEETLSVLEGINIRIQDERPEVKRFIQLTLSDLIRDYSNQEPSDLRIRKRISPFPEIGILEAWKNNADKYLSSIEGAQRIKRYDKDLGKAILCDIRGDISSVKNEKFDAMVTSPPYATALPYIDTQRISLVWLGLCHPDEIMRLESSLIGSREFYSNEKKKWQEELKTNREKLPKEIDELIDSLTGDLQPTDGFRKQAVPVLLYRYFVDMKKMFHNTYNLMKTGGKYGLIVGNNKTTIGGSRRVIDTPYLLSLIAEECGWVVEELLVLQTYKRYGINSKNAINSETLIILKK